MSNISSVIENMLEYSISEINRSLVVTAFDLLERFKIEDYQTKYEELATNSDKYDPSFISDSVMSCVGKDLQYIINMHGIVLNEENETTLDTLLKICDCLYRLQNLDNYTTINKLSTSTLPSELKFASIVSEMCDVEKITIMDAITHVEDTLFEVIVEFNTPTDEANSIGIAKPNTDVNKDRCITASFFEFLGEQSTIGGRLFKTGWDRNIKLEELLKLLPINVTEYLSGQFETTTHRALEIMSILMLCDDCRKQPMSMFRDNHILFVDSLTELTKYNVVIGKIYEDFNKYFKSKG